MADNKRRGRFGRGSDDGASQSIFDLFEPPPEQDASSLTRIPIIRDDSESLDLTGADLIEAQAAAEAEAAGLAHWTEPPTGQVPAAFATAAQDDRWADVRGPSWQGEEPNWAGPDLSDVFADTEAISHHRVVENDDDTISIEPPPVMPPPRRQIRPESRDSSPSVFDERPADRARPAAPASRPPSLPAPGAPSVSAGIPRPATAAPRRVAAAPQPTAAPRPVTPSPSSDRSGERVASPPSRMDPVAASARPAPNPSVPAPARPPVPVAATVPPALAVPPPRSADRPVPRPGEASPSVAVPPPRPVPRPEAARPAPVSPPPVSAPPRPEAAQRASNQTGPLTGPPTEVPRPIPPRFDEPMAGLDPRISRGAHDLPAATIDLDQTARTARPPLPERPAGRAFPAMDQPPVRLPSESPRLLQDSGYDPGPDADYEEYEPLDDPDEGGRGFSQRIVVGVALAALVLVALGLGPDITMVLIGLVTLLAVLELFNTMRIAGLRPATLLGLVGTVALPAATYVRGEAGYPLVAGLAVVFGMLWYLTGADTERPVLNLGLTLTGILWIGGLAGFAALMLRAEDGTGLLLATILITAASDTLAYVGGRAYGTKPFHSASPNKTWEGTLTGFFGALFAGLVIGVTDVIGVFEGQFISVIVLAAVVGVLAPIGDLAESLVKRDLGVKDMGHLLPGHGGALDRVDGLLFALPGAYYVAVIYHLV